MKLAIPAKAVPYLLVTPLALVFLFFLVVPMMMVLVASFFDFNMTGLVPTLTLGNYIDLLTSRNTFALYLQTLKYALIVWAITLVLGSLLPISSPSTSVTRSLRSGSCCYARCRSGRRTSSG